MSSDILYTRTNGLQPNALDAKIYGEDEPIDDLVNSIRVHGIRTPLLILGDGTVLSGVRRLRAARQLGLETVPVYYSSLTDQDEIALAVIDCNKQREKTEAQKGREYIELERIERALAEKRAKAGRSADGTAGGRGRAKAAATFEVKSVISPRLRGDQQGTKPEPRGDIRTPPANSPRGSGEHRVVAAKRVGWGKKKAEEARKVIERAEATGDHHLIETMNTRSVHAAMQEMLAEEAAERGPDVPKLKAQALPWWSVAAPVDGMGLSGEADRLPGDVARQLYWFFTAVDERVVALNDWAGVALDAARHFQAQTDCWELTCHSYAPAPKHPAVKKFDYTQPPYLPPEAAGANLIFLDAPDWAPKGKGAAGLPLADYHDRLLAILGAAVKAAAPGGYAAVLISPTRQETGRLSHAAHLVVRFRAAPLRYQFTVQVERSGHDLAYARECREIRDDYRDLLLFQRPEAITPAMARAVAKKGKR
jgi:ParB-like chromosome segregation protein Spo0J